MYREIGITDIIEDIPVSLHFDTALCSGVVGYGDVGRAGIGHAGGKGDGIGDPSVGGQQDVHLAAVDGCEIGGRDVPFDLLLVSCLPGDGGVGCCYHEGS